MEIDKNSGIYEDCENSQSISNFYNDNDNDLFQTKKKQWLFIQYLKEE